MMSYHTWSVLNNGDNRVTENTPRKEIKIDSPHGNLSNNQEKTHLNISKEEYERQFSTMENAWRKQFEELDKKYQNEIKKLQEELKKAMEQNQNNCKKLILEQNEKDHTNEEESKQVTEKRKMDNFETEFIRRMCLYDEDRFIDIKIQGKNQEKGKQMNEEEIQMNKCKNPESEEEVEIGVTENTPRKEIKIDSPHGNLSNNQEKTHLNASKKFNYRLDLSRAAKEYRDEDEQNTEQLKNMLANSSRDKRTSFLTYVVDSHVQQELSNVKKFNRQQSMFDLNRSKPAFGDLIAQNKKEQDTVKDQSKDTKEKSAIVKGNNDKQKDTENDELKTKKFDVPYAQKFNDQEIPSDSVGKIILKNNRSMDQTNYMEPNRYESNHINSLDYLNQNDELTKNQMDDIIADSNKINVNKDLFFTDMDHNIFDFKGESSRKNTGFYNDNFAKNISQLVTINSKEIKRTFHDKTFKIGEKSFVHDGDGITNLLNNVKRGTQADKSKPTRMTEIGSLISKLDDKPVDTIKNIDESKVKTVKFASEIETKDDTLSEPTRDKPSETIPFQGTQLDLEEENFTHQTIKHSEKYFGDISRVKRTESQDDPSIISTDSSSEIFDKVLNVTNPDNQFYYEMVETSTSESSQCRDEVSNEALTAPMTAISREQIIRPVGKTSRAKDLSIIEEETETDSSSIPSIKIDKIIPRQTMYVDSSSDDSTIQDISSEPENENFKKPKLLPDNILADLSKRVQDIEEIVDGQFKDIREQDSESTLIYWDGENRPRERQAEARSTFDKLANLTNNTTTVTIHKAPVKETKSTVETPKIEEKRDISGTPPKTESTGKVDKDEKVNEGKANVFKDDSTVDNLTTTNLEKRLAKRDEVVTKFEKVMKKFNLNPEWLTLPENTFEQKMQIIVHDRTLKTKVRKVHVQSPKGSEKFM
ncbi:uncharacterized protein PFB0145c-like [Diaphorina citri]|uniref:Uncharacterized protein PFB0145c-like n=1 Tax=Diaphorina citri TaxID=121845 RepID=A0A3Q0IL56_DIACI|nr:uncharacterized protein PFB0145c-like [Diaphorina citri]